jgi:phosphohistidine phosphatase SixA
MGTIMSRTAFAPVLSSLLLMLCLALPTATRAEPGAATFFLVRHAEKVDDSDDPELAEAGKQRASVLARTLKDAGIERVYSSDYRRTRDTASLLAVLLELPVEIYDPLELPALADMLRQSGQNSLIVGHSNTTPELAALLGGDPGPEIDEESEYDRLYIVTIETSGEASSVLLRYGTN